MRGAAVFVADVDWNTLNQHRLAYERVLQLCGVSVAYQDQEPAELYDPQSY